MDERCYLGVLEFHPENITDKSVTVDHNKLELSSKFFLHMPLDDNRILMTKGNSLVVYNSESWKLEKTIECFRTLGVSSFSHILQLSNTLFATVHARYLQYFKLAIWDISKSNDQLYKVIDIPRTNNTRAVSIAFQDESGQIILITDEICSPERLVIINPEDNFKITIHPVDNPLLRYHSFMGKAANNNHLLLVHSGKICSLEIPKIPEPQLIQEPQIGP